MALALPRLTPESGALSGHRIMCDQLYKKPMESSRRLEKSIILGIRGTSVPKV